MGSKGSSTQQTSSTSRYTPSPQITAAGTQALQGGQAASQQPFWLPQQPIAGFTPDQLAAFQNVRNMQGMTSPWFGAAGNLAMSSAQPLTGEQIGQFYNPMAANVTAQLQNIFGQQMRNTTGQATQAAGGVGADRIGVAQANLANQQGLAAGQTYSQLYQQALQAAMQNQQMQANAAYAMGNLGAGAQGAALQGNQALLGVGGLQQQLAQAQLMSPYAWLGQQFAYPYQANQYLAGVTGALVPAFPSTTTGQSTTTATPAQPSPFSQIAGLGMAGLGAYQSGLFPGGFNPMNLGSAGGTSPMGGGSAGAIYRHGGGVRGYATGGNPTYPLLPTGGAPSLPSMGAGTEAEAQQYSDDIAKQAANLASMSRYAMQPTGTGGWRQSSFVPGASQQSGTGQISGLPQGRNVHGGWGGIGKGSGMMADLLPFMQSGSSKDLSSFFGNQPQTGTFADGGATGSGGMGDDPFGSTDSLVPNIHLSASPFKPPELPKPPSMASSGSGGSGKGSDISTAINVGMKVLPFLMAAHGGGVGPFSHYQHFQEGGGDDSGGMTDISAFPFTPTPDTGPSPDGLDIGRFPFTPTGGANLPPVGAGEYATPQEAEQARRSKELFAKRVGEIPVGGQTASPTAIEESPFLPKATRGMTYETAGAATPEAPPRGTSLFGGLPAMAEVPIPEEPGRAPVTPVERRDIPRGPFDLPVTTGGRPAPEEAAAFKPPIETPFQPPPSAIPSPEEAAAFKPEMPPPLPRPRPDIAGPPGQAFAAGAPPVPPVSRQSVAQDTLYYANKNGVPPQIALRLINRESGFNPNVRGAAGEIGAGQIMPATARELGINPHDPAQNLDGAMRYLKQQYDRFGNWPQAIAAYNAGPGAVASGRIPASTRAYVADVAGGGAPDITQLSAKALAPAGGGETGAPMPTAEGEIGPARYTLPAGQTPFPQAGANAPGADLARNPWVMAGLRIAAGTSPWAAVNIGAGASQALEKQREQAEKEVSVNQHAQQLYQQMMQHVDTMTKLTPAQAAANWHQTYDLNSGNPIIWRADANGVPQIFSIKGGQLVPAEGAVPADVGGAGTPPVAGAPGVPPGTTPAAGTAIPTPAPQSTETPTNTSPEYVAPSSQMVTTFQGGGPKFTPRGTPQPAVEDARKAWTKYQAETQPAMAGTESQLATIFQDADSANKDLAKAGGLGQFLLSPGPGATYRNQIASIIRSYGGAEKARAMGIPENVIADITSMDKAQQYLTNALTRALGAREAVQVLQMNKNATPGWEQTEEGRIKVSNDLWQTVQRQKDLMNFAQKWDQMNNGDMRGMMTAFDAANPVQRYAARAKQLAEYDVKTYNAPADVKAKLYDLPKAKQWEMYDRAPELKKYMGNPALREAVNKRYNGLAEYIAGLP